MALDMFVNIQVEHEQLVAMMPLLANSGVRLLVDHCGRPTIDAGLDQPGFRALLEMGSTKRALRQALGARQVLARAFAARGCVALRAGAGRRIHARSLPVGVGLAVPPRADAGRLRRGAEPRARRSFPMRPSGASCCGTRRVSCWVSGRESRRARRADTSVRRSRFAIGKPVRRPRHLLFNHELLGAVEDLAVGDARPLMLPQMLDP